MSSLSLKDLARSVLPLSVYVSTCWPSVADETSLSIGSESLVALLLDTLPVDTMRCKENEGVRHIVLRAAARLNDMSPKPNGAVRVRTWLDAI